MPELADYRKDFEEEIKSVFTNLDGIKKLLSREGLKLRGGTLEEIIHSYIDPVKTSKHMAEYYIGEIKRIDNVLNLVDDKYKKSQKSLDQLKKKGLQGQPLQDLNKKFSQLDREFNVCKSSPLLTEEILSFLGDEKKDWDKIRRQKMKGEISKGDYFRTIDAIFKHVKKKIRDKAEKPYFQGIEETKKSLQDSYNETKEALVKLKKLYVNISDKINENGIEALNTGENKRLLEKAKTRLGYAQRGIWRGRLKFKHLVFFLFTGTLYGYYKLGKKIVDGAKIGKALKYLENLEKETSVAGYDKKMNFAIEEGKKYRRYETKENYDGFLENIFKEEEEKGEKEEISFKL